MVGRQAHRTADEGNALEVARHLAGSFVGVEHELHDPCPAAELDGAVRERHPSRIVDGEPGGLPTRRVGAADPDRGEPPRHGR